MRALALDNQRELDVICLGRAGVDLYAQQPEQAFSQVSGFNKFVGGSPANIATTLAKLGAKAGFIGCVSKDGLGDYVRDYLARQNIDLTGLHTEASGTRTSLALTQMQPNDPEVVLYRNNAADLALAPQQISAPYLARAKMLLVSGTALCASPSREAALLAMKLAKQHNTKVVLDIDYRAYSWPDIETASLYYQLAAGLSDIVIGNTEEFAVLGALNTECEITPEQQARALIKSGCQLVIVKAGRDGSVIYPAQGDAFKGAVFHVQAQKPFGAGDAFAGSLLFGLINQYSLQDAVAMGAASAAINVAGSSCTEASPSLAQLQQFMSDQSYQFDRQPNQ